MKYSYRQSKFYHDQSTVATLLHHIQTHFIQQVIGGWQHLEPLLTNSVSIFWVHI